MVHAGRLFQLGERLSELKLFGIGALDGQDLYGWNLWLLPLNCNHFLSQLNLFCTAMGLHTIFSQIDTEPLSVPTAFLIPLAGQVHFRFLTLLCDNDIREDVLGRNADIEVLLDVLQVVQVHSTTGQRFRE